MASCFIDADDTNCTRLDVSICDPASCSLNGRSVIGTLPTGPDLDAASRQFDRLEAKLLAFGGDRVAEVWPVADLEEMLQNGRLLDLPTHLRRGYWPMHTANTAALWCKNIQRYQVDVGYVLSEDGQWRFHSWVRGDGCIYECTAPQKRYFGKPVSKWDAYCLWRRHVNVFASVRLTPAQQAEILLDVELLGKQMQRESVESLKAP